MQTPFLASAEFQSSAKTSIFLLYPKPFRKRIPFENPRLPPNRQTAAIPNPIPNPATSPTSLPMAASEAQGDPHRRDPGQRRPMCAVCTKPLRVCLCGRLRGPPFDTTVGVTVLQHTMEVNHPLSSIRVARLGLRNLAVTQVSDVNHRASFLLRTLDCASMASNLGGGETDVTAARAGNHDRPSGPGQIGIHDANGFGRCEGQGLENGKLSNGVFSDSDRQVGSVEYDSNADAGFSSFEKVKRDKTLGGFRKAGLGSRSVGKLSSRWPKHK